MERKKLEKFGKVEEMCQYVYNYEFKITDGFSGNARDSFELLELCSIIADGYTKISFCKTDKNFFHLILTKI